MSKKRVSFRERLFGKYLGSDKAREDVYTPDTSPVGSPQGDSSLIQEKNLPPQVIPSANASQLLGVSTLWEGDPNDTTVDIVTVHGLNGHPHDTWTHPSNGNLWLKDFLPQAMPTARVLTFGYPAKVFDSRSNMTIRECAQSLLSGLKTQRGFKGSGRPLIFIGHSMGGLVIKKALLEAKEKETYEEIWLATCGIMFMAVPHTGSSTASFGETLANIAKVAAPTNTAMLKELNDDSQDLRELSNRFGNIHRKLRLITVLEGERTPLPNSKRGSVQVVEDKSARLNVGEEEFKIMGSNHHTVCKFANQKDPQYLQVQDSLLRLVSSAVHTATAVPDYYQDFLMDICEEDPRNDMIRIRESKGGLLPQCYNWLLDNPQLKEWRYGTNRLLWIRGDPGKGKTMLMIGLVETLEGTLGEGVALSYFFCQNGSDKLNNGISLLRGLIWRILQKHSFLHTHIPAVYPSLRSRMFSSDNVFFILKDMLAAMLCDPRLGSIRLCVDALDECSQESLRPMIEWIVDNTSSPACRAKWVLSSRNTPWIEELLGRTGIGERLILELNDLHIEKAVRHFVRTRVDKLSQIKKYEDQFKDKLEARLVEKCESTFLWVALVCQRLEQVPSRHVFVELGKFPSNLRGLYERMLNIIEHAEADDPSMCRQLLKAACCAFRPLTLLELQTIADLEDKALTQDDLQELILLCGSFLFLREGIVYFVHQSARQYLENEVPTDHAMAPFVDQADGHSLILKRSIKAMSKTLCQKNIFGIHSPGIAIVDIEQPRPDPLAAIRYSCVYWIDHFCQVRSDHEKERLCDGPIRRFLAIHFLYWLEALSLMQQITVAVNTMRELEVALTAISSMQDLNNLVRHAIDFIVYHRSIIETVPLQIYASALLFTPAKNQIRELFFEDRLPWIRGLSSDLHWGIIQTFQGHEKIITKLLYTPDGQRLVSFSMDASIRIWDLTTGALQSILPLPASPVASSDTKDPQSSISADSHLLAVGSRNGTIDIWSIRNGTLKHRLDLSGLGMASKELIPFLEFLPDVQLITATFERTQIWNAVDGSLVRTVECHPFHVLPDRAGIVDPRKIHISKYSKITILGLDFKDWCFSHSTRFSPDGCHVAVTSTTSSVLYDIILNEETRVTESIWEWQFFPNSQVLAYVDHDREFAMLDMKTGQRKYLMDPDILSLVISRDGRRIATARSDFVIQIRDLNDVLSAEQHMSELAISDMFFSRDEQKICLADRREGLRVISIDIASGEQTCTELAGNSFVPFERPVLMHGQDWLVTTERTAKQAHSYVQIWSAESRACVGKFTSSFQFEAWKGLLTVSQDGNFVATTSGQIKEGTIEVIKLDPRPSEIRFEIRIEYDVIAMAISPDNRRIAVNYGLKTQEFVWATKNGIFTINNNEREWETPSESMVNAMTFSPSGKWLVMTLGRTIEIADANTGAPQYRLDLCVWIATAWFLGEYNLMTAQGCIALDALAGPKHIRADEIPWKAYGMDSDFGWITWNGARVLAIPAEFRPLYEHDPVTGKHAIAILRSDDELPLIVRFNLEVPPIPTQANLQTGRMNPTYGSLEDHEDESTNEGNRKLEPCD